MRLLLVLTCSLSTFLAGCVVPNEQRAAPQNSAQDSRFDPKQISAIAVVAGSSGSSVPRALTGVADQATTEQIIKRGYSVVQRRFLTTAIKELKLSESGLINPAKALEAGKMDGATHLLVVNITQYQRGTSRQPLRVDVAVQLIDVSRGVVLYASSGSNVKGFPSIADGDTGVATRKAITNALLNLPMNTS